MLILRFLISKNLWVHVVLALCFFLLLLLVTFGWLKTSTRHGESMAVPNITGIELEKAIQILNQRNLRYQITDSVFFPDKPRNAVVDQNPLPDEKVKEGRVIYLTLNSSEPPQVKMPNLIDVSYRQAVSILQSCGLKEGQITYKPDLAQNIVLSQQIAGRSVSPESLVPKGSAVDLVLGDGMGSTTIDIPDLTGLSYQEALFVLKGSGLAAGNTQYDVGATETTAKVYLQNPAAPGKISQGQSIDLMLK